MRQVLLLCEVDNAPNPYNLYFPLSHFAFRIFSWCSSLITIVPAIFISAFTAKMLPRIQGRLAFEAVGFNIIGTLVIKGSLHIATPDSVEENSWQRPRHQTADADVRFKRFSCKLFYAI